MAELASLGDDDDDSAHELAEQAIDELGHAAQAAGEHEPPPAPVIIEPPALPDPADAVAAEAKVVIAEAQAQATVINAETDAQIRLMHERHELEKEIREEERAADDAVDPLEIIDEVLGPIDLDLPADTTPQSLHRWFRPITRGRR
jgi:hypothetical protein